MSPVFAGSHVSEVRSFDKMGAGYGHLDGLGLVESYPFRDETVEWMGHPA